MSRHDALRATWAEGQRWETRLDQFADNENAWVPVGHGGLSEPAWNERQEYRRVEEPVPAPTLLQRIEQIAGDFVPDNDRDAPQALQEMRDALMTAVEAARGAKGGA